MINFFDLWKKAINVRPGLLLEIGYTSVTDYMIVVCDRTGSETAKDVFEVQKPVIEEAFAEAYIKLIEYLNETCGGY